MTAELLDRHTIAELTARMYLDTGAVRFMQDKPFIFTSGWASPVYNDSRWLISFPDVRSTLMDFAVATIGRDVGLGEIDAVAGGEEAERVATGRTEAEVGLCNGQMLSGRQRLIGKCKRAARRALNARAVQRVV